MDISGLESSSSSLTVNGVYSKEGGVDFHAFGRRKYVNYAVLTVMFNDLQVRKDDFKIIAGTATYIYEGNTDSEGIPFIYTGDIEFLDEDNLNLKVLKIETILSKDVIID